MKAELVNKLLADNPWLSGVPTREIARRLGIDRRAAAYLKGRAEGREETPVEQPKSIRGPSILVVGDVHLEPEQDMSRMTWLGRYVRDHLTPEDYVVFIGDVAGLTSLCSHNNARQREGLRLADDLKATNQGIKMFYDEIPAARRPQVFMTTGNHDARIERLSADRPEFSGVVGMDLFDWKKYGATVVPFLQPLRIHGVRFQHYLSNGGGRAISGINHARNLLKRVHHSESVVVGHSHNFAVETHASVVGGRKWGLVVGCYFDHVEHYAGTDSNVAWWAGIVHLHNVRDGDFDLETYRLADLRERYSDEA